MNCLFCNKICIKKGIRNKIQKWLCRSCGKWQQEIYRNNKVTGEKVLSIIDHNNEGNSISSIARLVRLSKASVQRVIEKFARALDTPIVEETGQEYEVDELCTYVGKRKNIVWVMYAINKLTKQVMKLVVGKRTGENLRR